MSRTNVQASLVRYARIEGMGWRRGSIITAKNGRVRHDAMSCSGKVHTIPVGSAYQIRYYEDGKVRYTTVGADYDAAVTFLEKFQASRQLKAAENALGIVKPKDVTAPKTLADYLNEFLSKKKSPSL